MPACIPAAVGEDLAMAALAGYWASKPIPAGLVTGAAMSVVAEALMTPALGFSAPNLNDPLATACAGGVATHLLLRLAVAAVSETAWSLRGRRP